MGFIVSLRSYDCQNHRISDKNKLRKALCLVARLVSFYYNSNRQAVSRRYFFSSHACWHGLCDFLALCRCFLQFFVSFIICFLKIIFNIATESPASFLMILFYHKELLSFPKKSKKAEFILGRFISHLQKWRTLLFCGNC